MARASNKPTTTTLPLRSTDWWTLGETQTYCQSRPLFRLEDLAAAVEQEQVPCKLEYLIESTRPAKQVVLLLTSEFFQHVAAIVPFWHSLALKGRTKNGMHMQVPRPHALYFWGPRVRELWPSQADAAPVSTTPATPAKITAKEARRLTPIEWAKLAPGRFPQKKGESREQHFERLTKIMSKELEEKAWSRQYLEQRFYALQLLKRPPRKL